MAEIALRTPPCDLSRQTLHQLLSDVDNRETILQAVTQHFQQHYGIPLEELEARLNRGEGREHPDWEDSIEWRNALEAAQRTRTMRSLLEWLLALITH